jgi:ribosomal protein S18 acetylase RimI-like enzyme
MQIRELNNKDDLGLLVKLSRAFFLEYESNHPYFFKIDKIEESDIEKYFQRFIDNEDKKAFIAIEGGSIVGYISVLVLEQAAYWRIKRIGHISGLMVDKAHRRKGTGRMLLKAALEFFNSKGLRQYTLFTSVNNEDGIKFYKRSGLTELYITLMGEI